MNLIDDKNIGNSRRHITLNAANTNERINKPVHNPGETNQPTNQPTKNKIFQRNTASCLV